MGMASLWPMVTVSANQTPTASAGPDQAVSDADGSGAEVINLAGSGSLDPDGTIALYEWREGATVLGTETSISPSLTVGSHTITLIVTDNGGATGSDTVEVTVSANQTPTAGRFILCDNAVGEDQGW